MAWELKACMAQRDASWETHISPAWKISSTEQIRRGSEILIGYCKFTNEKSYRLYFIICVSLLNQKSLWWDHSMAVEATAVTEINIFRLYFSLILLISEKTSVYFFNWILSENLKKIHYCSLKNCQFSSFLTQK